jgi:hypothetical protein
VKAKSCHGFFVIGFVIAAIQFCLLWLAIWLSFTIFKGPSTGSEIFWGHVSEVLQFPGSVAFDLSSNAAWVTSVWIVNSLVWGAVLSGGILIWKSLKARRNSQGVID